MHDHLMSSSLKSYTSLLHYSYIIHNSLHSCNVFRPLTNDLQWSPKLRQRSPPHIQGLQFLQIPSTLWTPSNSFNILKAFKLLQCRQYLEVHPRSSTPPYSSKVANTSKLVQILSRSSTSSDFECSLYKWLTTLLSPLNLIFLLAPFDQ